jgi:hypothetical protein
MMLKFEIEDESAGLKPKLDNIIMLSDVKEAISST